MRIVLLMLLIGGVLLSTAFVQAQETLKDISKDVGELEDTLAEIDQSLG